MSLYFKLNLKANCGLDHLCIIFLKIPVPESVAEGILQRPVSLLRYPEFPTPMTKKKSYQVYCFDLQKRKTQSRLPLSCNTHFQPLPSTPTVTPLTLPSSYLKGF